MHGTGIDYKAPWGWHDIVETCRSVIICEIIVPLLAIVQNDLNGFVRFTRKTKSVFCACGVTFQTPSTSWLGSHSTTVPGNWDRHYFLLFHYLYRASFIILYNDQPLHSPISPFTSRPVRQSVPSHFSWTLPTFVPCRVERKYSYSDSSVGIATRCWLDGPGMECH